MLDQFAPQRSRRGRPAAARSAWKLPSTASGAKPLKVDLPMPSSPPALEEDCGINALPTPMQSPLISFRRGKRTHQNVDLDSDASLSQVINENTVLPRKRGSGDDRLSKDKPIPPAKEPHLSSEMSIDGSSVNGRPTRTPPACFVPFSTSRYASPPDSVGENEPMYSSEINPSDYDEDNKQASLVKEYNLMKTVAEALGPNIDIFRIHQSHAHALKLDKKSLEYYLEDLKALGDRVRARYKPWIHAKRDVSKHTVKFQQRIQQDYADFLAQKQMMESYAGTECSMDDDSFESEDTFQGFEIVDSPDEM